MAMAITASKVAPIPRGNAHSLSHELAKVAPIPRGNAHSLSHELAVTSERSLQQPAIWNSAASGGDARRRSRFALGTARIHHSSSSARRDIYRDDGSLQGEPWRELVRNRGRVLLLVAGVALLAAPVVLLSVTASHALARATGQEERQCGTVTSDWGVSHIITTSCLSMWFCCLGVHFIGCSSNPNMRRKLFFVAVAGPLALCVQTALFISSPPQTVAFQLLLGTCTLTLPPFLADLAYIASRFVTGSKTVRQVLRGLAASALAAIASALLGLQIELYQLIPSGAALGLSTPYLLAVNCVLYPIVVHASKRGVALILQARVARDRLDFVGLLTLEITIIATSQQAFISLGYDGVNFLASLVVCQLLELGLTWLTAHSAGAVEAVHRTLSSRSLRRTFADSSRALMAGPSGSLTMALPPGAAVPGSQPAGRTRLAAAALAAPQPAAAAAAALPARHSSTASAASLAASPRARETSTSVFLAIQAAYSAPGELIGIISAAVIFAIAKGLNGDFLGKVFAMLITELVTDELSVLIYHRYRIWVRRVHVQLPRLAVVGVVFGAVGSSLVVLGGVLLVCLLRPN